MTTNRMGLEQEDDHGLSAHLEVLEAMIEPGDTENQQLICLLLELKRRRANTTLPLQAVTVPDEVTFDQAMLMAYGLTPAEAFQKAWNHLRGKILESVTNEP